MALDYGTCPCSGKYESRRVEVRMTLKNEPVVLEDIPQGACPLCGSRIYKTEHLLYIESVMKFALFEHLNAHTDER